MSRRCFALLITTERWPQLTPPCAMERVQRLTKLLTDHFGGRLSAAVLVGASATVKGAKGALRRLVQVARSGDLVFVAFVGHGYNRRTGQGWRLYDGRFSDYILAKGLRPLPPEVEVLVVSDACYGAGMLEPGARALALAARASDLDKAFDLDRALELTLARSYASNLLDKVSAPRRRRRGKKTGRRQGRSRQHLVCIASASLNELAEPCSDFVARLCELLPQVASYAELTPRLRPAAAQFNWIVDAFPKELLDQRPLAP